MIYPRPRGPIEFLTDPHCVSPRNPKGYCNPAFATQAVGPKLTRLWVICPWCFEEKELDDDGQPGAIGRGMHTCMIEHKACWLAHDMKVNGT